MESVEGKVQELEMLWFVKTQGAELFGKDQRLQPDGSRTTLGVLGRYSRLLEALEMIGWRQINFENWTVPHDFPTISVGRYRVLSRSAVLAQVWPCREQGKSWWKPESSFKQVVGVEGLDGSSLLFTSSFAWQEIELRNCWPVWSCVWICLACVCICWQFSI